MLFNETGDLVTLVWRHLYQYEQVTKTREEARMKITKFWEIGRLKPERTTK